MCGRGVVSGPLQWRGGTVSSQGAEVAEETPRETRLSPLLYVDRRERSVCEAGEGAAGVTCAELKRISKIKAFPKPDKPVCIWSFATLGL